MKKLVDCFIPRGNEEETKRNLEALKAEELVGNVTVIEGDVKASQP